MQLTDILTARDSDTSFKNIHIQRLVCKNFQYHGNFDYIFMMRKANSANSCH